MEGVRLWWMHVVGREGVKPHVDVHTENKNRVHFFLCKEVGVFFIRISSFDGIKSGKFSAI